MYIECKTIIMRCIIIIIYFKTGRDRRYDYNYTSEHNETRKIIMLHIIRKMRNTMSIYNYTSDQ